MSEQQSRYEPDFNGTTYDPDQDKQRLGNQLLKVRDFMLREEWLSLRTISESLGFPEASVSARLRDLRKPKNGSFDVRRRRAELRGSGTWLYRVRPLDVNL